MINDDYETPNEYCVPAWLGWREGAPCVPYTESDE